jgi:hypothetical protein
MKRLWLLTATSSLLLLRTAILSAPQTPQPTELGSIQGVVTRAGTAVWMLSPALLPLMATVLAPCSLSRIRQHEGEER